MKARRDRIKLQTIPIQAVEPSPYQARRTFTTAGLGELAASIRQNGLLQPIVVRSTANGYQLIAGERRLRACGMAGYESIRAIVLSVDNEQAALLCMVENLQREQLHFFEEAQGYERLIRIHGLTQQKLAERLGKQQSTIANKLRLLRLDERIKAKILRYNLSERHARALLRLPDTASRREILNQIIKEDLNVRETEDLIRQHLAPPEKGRANIQRIYSDWRLLNNSVKAMVNKMRRTGSVVHYQVQDMGSSIMMSITMPKVQSKKTAAK